MLSNRIPARLFNTNLLFSLFLSIFLKIEMGKTAKDFFFFDVGCKYYWLILSCIFDDANFSFFSFFLRFSDDFSTSLWETEIQSFLSTF